MTSELGGVAAQLDAARSELDAHVERIEAEARANGSASISFGKRIGDGTSVAVERLNEIAILERLTKQRRMVVRAQAKLADGSYGICDGCGAKIASTRLEALPWAIHCLQCADLESVPEEQAPSTGSSGGEGGPRSATSGFASPWDSVSWTGERQPDGEPSGEATQRIADLEMDPGD